MKKYYLAYGSNLSVEQMAVRCPDAIYLGRAEIPDYRLLFKGSLTGSYLTIEKKKGSKVPVVVWGISESDERNLDHYEGCPVFYYKEEFRVTLEPFIDDAKPILVKGIVYIMHEERELGCPTVGYYRVCAEGYRRFDFDPEILAKALFDSVGKRKGVRLLEEVVYGG